MFTKISTPTFRRVVTLAKRLCSGRKQFKPVSHCIFDMDGTILDNEITYTRAMNAVLEPFGKSVSIKEKFYIMGKPTKDMSRFMVKHYKLPFSSEEFLRRLDIFLREFLPNDKLKPGVARLLRHLKAHDVPTALATSSGKDMFFIKSCPHKEIFKLLEPKVLGGTDPAVKRGKPAPDIFLITASRFPDKPNPCCCLVFEDSPSGMIGALAAGMQCVLTPMPELPCKFSKPATLRLRSLTEFQPEQFGLPPFDD